MPGKKCGGSYFVGELTWGLLEVSRNARDIRLRQERENPPLATDCPAVEARRILSFQSVNCTSYFFAGPNHTAWQDNHV
jgi:hypothetical protein